MPNQTLPDPSEGLRTGNSNSADVLALRKENERLIQGLKLVLQAARDLERFLPKDTDSIPVSNLRWAIEQVAGIPMRTFEPEFDQFDITCLNCMSKNVTLAYDGFSEHMKATCEMCRSKELSKS